MVTLGCAHPAKFTAAVEKAVGRAVPLPSHMADMMDRPERESVLPNDLGALQEFIQEMVQPRGCGVTMVLAAG